MNNQDSRKLIGVIELLLESSSRINQAKEKRYWYPLSQATYGVEEIIEAVDSMCTFRTTMWEKTRLFEEQFAEFQGARHAVMVNSGSSADLLMSFCLTSPYQPRLKLGDEILVPALTWPTHAWSAAMSGLKVRLVDVDPTTLNVHVEDLESKITDRTRAIFLAHIMGNPCPMDVIQRLSSKHGLLVLEDCCESLGATWGGIRVGNFGFGGAFSFFFSHHMTTMEGGMITCNDPQTADHLRILRAHGWLRNVEFIERLPPEVDLDPRYAFVSWGFNLRPTELQAGFGLHQLRRLPGYNFRREQLAARFFEFVDCCPHLTRPRPAPQARPAWFALPVLVRPEAPFRRRDLTDHLEANGVETRPIVAGNLARQPVRDQFSFLREAICPGADHIHTHGFYVGLSPLTTDAEMDRLVGYFDQFMAGFR